MASPLQKRFRKAVRDPILRKNVLRATDTSLRHRLAVVAERPDWEELKDRAADIRDEVLGDLDRYLEQFVLQARRRGAHVHMAKDAAQARRIILDGDDRMDPDGLLDPRLVAIFVEHHQGMAEIWNRIGQ